MTRGRAKFFPKLFTVKHKNVSFKFANLEQQMRLEENRHVFAQAVNTLKFSDLHDNGLAHLSILVQYNVVQFRQVSYNSEMIPCEYWLLTRLNEDIVIFQTNATNAMKIILKTRFQE